MNNSDWFDDLPVIGAMAPEQAAQKLCEIGEEELAAELTPPEGREAFAPSNLERWLSKPWKHTTHTYGFIAHDNPRANDPLLIRHAGNIDADSTLKNSQIKITLDRLRVASYPGFGIHHVLFDFYGRHQVPKMVEHLHFNATYRVRDGEEAGVSGRPIFVGLKVGAEGVDFKCLTINVKNESDERFLGILDSDVFKAGLKLAINAQPAIAPLSGLAQGLARSIGQHNRNVPVQNFELGLDFSNVPTRAHLRTGSYVVVQIPQNFTVIWDWNDWRFDPKSGQLVSAEDPLELVPYNYIVFGVSRYEGD